MNKRVTFLITIVVLVAVGLVYFVFQNQKKLKDTGTQIVPNNSTQDEKITQPSPSAAVSPTPSALTQSEVLELIKKSSNNTDHSAILPYLSKSKVNFIIMSSSCCEPKTPQEAADSLNYIDPGIPFEFDQNSKVVKTLKEKNDRLKNTYIGISQTKEHLIAYTLNFKNEITQIEVSVSWKLYNL